jgi:hypothetical protein
MPLSHGTGQMHLTSSASQLKVTVGLIYVTTVEGMI